MFYVTNNISAKSIFEVGLTYGTGHSAGSGLAKNLAEQFYIGADPMKIEKIRESIFRGSFRALDGGSVVYGGMGGIDMTLRDIKD